VALWTRLLSDGAETKAVSRAEASDATARSLAAGSRAGLGHQSPLSQDNVEQVVEGHYKRVLWVFRCVDAIAQAECSLPIYAWQSHDDEAARADGFDHLERLLNGPDRPNRFEEYWEFRYRISTLLLLSQVGVFVEIVRDKATNDPAQLTILDSDAVEIIPDDQERVKAYRIRYRGKSGRIEQKELDPERVLWLRSRPHPKDPYKQVTPLQAAGLSADTDFLARMFNRNWLSNDGRVAQLIGIKAENGMDSGDVDQIKQMFGGGYTKAGETRVVEADAISVAQVGGNPADAQYTDLLSGSKQDILMAFGVSESFLSWAAGKTFDNSDNEIEVVWQNTMRWHCKAFASGFMPLIRTERDTPAVFAHDFSKVTQLQRGARLKADKAMAEFQAGLITADEYREATGKDPWKVAGTKVIWTPAGPVGKDDATTKAAQELVATNRPPTLPGADGAGGGTLPGAQSPAGALPRGGGSTGPGKPQVASQADMQALAGKLRSVVNERATEQSPGRRALAGAKSRLTSSPERKTARPRPPRRRRAVVDAEVVDEEWHDEHPCEARVKTAESELTRALGGVFRRMLGAIEGRLQSTKTRRGTRHWTLSPGETETKIERQLAAWYVVQVQRWGEQAAAEAGFLIRNAGSRAMADIRPELQLDAPALLLASRLVRQLVNRLTDDLRRGVEKRVREIERLIHTMDRDGASIEEIKRAVADRQDALDRWVAQVAPRVARAAVQGARKAMMDRVPDSVGQSVWRSTDDHRTRPSHVAADGQVAKRGHAFVIGGARMMFPGDPRAPAREWANCRCWLVFRRADGTEY
jgi:HK97 family phage portal protein